MRKLGLFLAAGAAFAFASCSDGGARDAEAAEAATGAEEAAAAEEAEATIDYVKDIGLLDDGMDDELSARLAAFHGESGHEIHIAVILTTDEQDIEEKAAEMIVERGISEGGALILIAAADESIGIVPAIGATETLTQEFTDATEAEMAEHFDAGEVAEGFNGAVDALIERLSGQG